MNYIPKNIAATHIANIQMLEDLAANVFGGFEELLWLSLAAAKSSFVDACRRAQILLDAKDEQEWLTLQKDVLQLPTEEYATHVQQLFSIGFGVHSALAKSLDTMLAAFTQAMNTGQKAIETAGRSTQRTVEFTKLD